MAFGQELKDFVNGFTTGYKLIDSPEDKAWERERRAMQKEGFEREGRWGEEDRSYRRERDSVGDDRWNRSWEFRQDQERYQRGKDEREWGRTRERDAVGDERFEQGIRERETERQYRDRRDRMEMYRDTGGAIPDDVDNFTPVVPGEEGAIEPTSMGGGGSNSWLRYSNQSATRNKPISNELETALAKIAPDLGLQVEVFSGGQEGARRTGSTRHDHGSAADVFFYKDGRKLDWTDPKDRPYFEEIVRRGKQVGLTGFGAGPGYMQRGSMHIGFGAPAVWGAGGSSANAPSWLRNAYHGQARGAAVGGLIEAIPTDEEVDPMTTGSTEEMVLPEEGPVPTPKPSYEGAKEGVEDEPTDDPYETARRAVREGMNNAIKQAQADVDGALNDPEMQEYKKRYIRGYGAAPSQVVKQMMDKIDPERTMSPNQRNMLAFANTYRFFWERGEPEKAKEAAGSLIQYYRQQSQQYLALAQAAAQEGDIDAAAKAAVAAYANVPNGRDLSIEKGEDGNYQVSVTDAKTGKAVTKQVISPKEMAAAAMQFNPTTFDDEILNAAGAPAEKMEVQEGEQGAALEGEVQGYVDEMAEGSNLTPESASGVRNIARGLASVKNNNIGVKEATELATRLLAFDGNDPENDKANFSVKPKRGNPDFFEVTIDGKNYDVPANTAAELKNLRGVMTKDRAQGRETKKANEKWWADQSDLLQKGVSAFGAAGDQAISGVEENTRASEAGSAIGGMVPKRNGPAPTSAIPEAPPAADNQEEINYLLGKRNELLARAKASNRDPREYGLADLEARLQELGYTPER
jgi:hypothetical protein